MQLQSKNKFGALLDHSLVFAGDLLPYSIIFLLTISVGYLHGLEATANFSLPYAYAAIVTALVCTPNLLSIRRQIPVASHPGAVTLAALALRVTGIAVGALAIFGLAEVEGGQTSIELTLLLLAARFFETAIDAPATIYQYKRRPVEYFALRLAVFSTSCTVALLGVLFAERGDVIAIAQFYCVASIIGFGVALFAARAFVLDTQGLGTELGVQIKEFGRFFAATAMYMVATRLHPMVISLVSGPQAAGQFAMVQNLFASVSMAATGIAGVFFWSKNRKGSLTLNAGVPRLWLSGAVLGGLALGTIGALAMDFLFLKPLGSSVELRTSAWLLCLSTPLLLAQTILSNVLVLMKRDREMLFLSTINGFIGLVFMAGLTFSFGLIGAALSISLAALIASIFGVMIARRTV